MHEPTSRRGSFETDKMKKKEEMFEKIYKKYYFIPIGLNTKEYIQIEKAMTKKGVVNRNKFLKKLIFRGLK